MTDKQENNKKMEATLKSALELNLKVRTKSEMAIIQYGLNEAVRLTDSEIGYFHFVNPDQETISLTTWSDSTRDYCDVSAKVTHYPISEAGVWVDCIRQRKPVFHNDYAALPHKKGLPEGHNPVIRDLGIPVFDGDKIIGVMGLGNKKTEYNQTDINQASLIAENIYSQVKARRIEDLRKQLADRLSLAVRSGQIGIWEYDIVNNRLVWDDRMYELYGVDKNKKILPYIIWENRLHPDD